LPGDGFRHHHTNSKGVSTMAKRFSNLDRSDRNRGFSIVTIDTDTAAKVSRDFPLIDTYPAFVREVELVLMPIPSDDDDSDDNG